MRQLPANCPPANASAHSGTIYRLIKSLTETKDFRSHFSRFPGKNWGDNLCNAHGLSVYTSLEEARKIQQFVPGMNKKQIASAELNGHMGGVAQTGFDTCHHTWWPADELDVVALFSLTEGA